MDSCGYINKMGNHRVLSNACSNSPILASVVFLYFLILFFIFARAVICV